MSITFRIVLLRNTKTRSFNELIGLKLMSHFNDIVTPDYLSFKGLLYSRRIFVRHLKDILYRVASFIEAEKIAFFTGTVLNSTLLLRLWPRL